jgi:predicted RNA-binding protein with PUA-like domain
MRYWMMKSEPSEFSIDDLAHAPKQSTPWFGVRNYQARNFMRDQMRLNDLAYFYHSSCPEPGIAGIVEITRLAYPDETQFDPKSPYFDPKTTAATAAAPRWVNVDVTLVNKTRFLPLAALRACPELAGLRLLERGSRLSITPVDPGHWKIIMAKLNEPEGDHPLASKPTKRQPGGTKATTKRQP